MGKGTWISLIIGSWLVVLLIGYGSGLKSRAYPVLLPKYYAYGTVIKITPGDPLYTITLQRLQTIEVRAAAACCCLAVGDSIGTYDRNVEIIRWFKTVERPHSRKR